MMQEAIDDGGRQTDIVGDGRPFGETLIGGEETRAHVSSRLVSMEDTFSDTDFSQFLRFEAFDHED